MRRFLLLAGLLSALLLVSCRSDAQSEKYSYSNAARYVFGVYEQDGIEENGPEDIVWCLMEKKDGKGLLVSEYALDTVVAYPELSAVGFGETRIAEWLKDFYRQAFTAGESKCICGTAFSNPVFLPDEEYFIFRDNPSFDCEPTPYARKNGVYSYLSSEGESLCWWFLQSEDRSEMLPCVIDRKTVSSVPVNTAGIGLRPAIWVNLDEFQKDFSLTVEGFDADRFFFPGDSPDLGEAVVLKTLKDKTSVPVESGYSVSPERFTETGRNYITVEYKGKKAVLETYVYPPALSCEVLTPPENLYYSVGAPVDLKGLTVRIGLQGGSEILMDKNFSYEPKVISSERDNKLTVTAGGHTFSYDLDVSPAISSLSIQCLKSSLNYGDRFDPTDFSVTAAFSDGRTETLPEALAWASSEASVYADPVLCLSYRGCRQEVPVRLIRTIEKITFDGNGKTFAYGDYVPLDLMATVTYSTGYSEEIPLLSVIGPRILGSRMSGTYFFSEEDPGTPYELTFSMKELKKIAFSLIEDYSVGDSFRPENCMVRFTYADGTSGNLRYPDIQPCFSEALSYRIQNAANHKTVSGENMKKGLYEAFLQWNGLSSTLRFYVSGRYELVTGFYSWSKAKAIAADHGGYLATITSPEEQEAVYKAARGNRVWLGGYRGNDGRWRWVTGEPWDYQNWGTGEPNGGENEPCLALWPEKWNDLTDCSNEQEGFIIEYD